MLILQQVLLIGVAVIALIQLGSSEK